jgi:hypothetical protein
VRTTEVAVCPLARQSAREGHPQLASSPAQFELSGLDADEPRQTLLSCQHGFAGLVRLLLAQSNLTLDVFKDQSTIASYIRLVQRSSRIAGRARMGLSSSTMPSYDPQTLVREKLALRDTAVVFSKTY